MRLVLILLLCASAVVRAQAPSGNVPMTRLQINDGVLYTRSGIPIHLSHAMARIAPGMHATASDGHTSKNDGDNKIVFLDSGRVGISNDSLTKLMNTKIQGKGIEDLKVTTDKGQVKISGKMKKVISLPVTIEGPCTATPDGKIELHTRKMKTGKLPIKGLADALGMNIQHVVGNKAKGVHAAADDSITFEPDELWNLPIHGTVTRVLVEKAGLVLIFGPLRRAPVGQIASSQ